MVVGSASHRLVDATVTLLDAEGMAVAEQPIRVSQRRHAFLVRLHGVRGNPARQ